MRTVSGKHGLTSATLAVVLCDKYMHPLTQVPYVVTTSSTGTFSLALPENRNDTCYVVETKSGRVQFWVYEGEGVQDIDFTKEVYKRNALPSLLSTDEKTLAVNAEAVMGDVFCGSPVISEEEQRLLSRHCDFQESNDDGPMCRVDKLLEERYENG